MLGERYDVEDRMLRLDAVNGKTQGRCQIHGVAVGATQEIRGERVVAGTPVEAGERRLVQAVFAGVRNDADDFRAFVERGILR